MSDSLHAVIGAKSTVRVGASVPPTVQNRSSQSFTANEVVNLSLRMAVVCASDEQTSLKVIEPSQAIEVGRSGHYLRTYC